MKKRHWSLILVAGSATYLIYIWFGWQRDKTVYAAYAAANGTQMTQNFFGYLMYRFASFLSAVGLSSLAVSIMPAGYQ